MQSARSIYVAVAILILATGVGGYVDVESDAMHARHMEVSKGLGNGHEVAVGESNVRLPWAKDSRLPVYIGAYSENLRLPGLSAYAAAKAGLEAFVTALGKEERRRRVTLVRPGAVNTPFWQKMPVRMPRSAAAPEEIAAKILAAHESGQSGALDL